MLVDVMALFRSLAYVCIAHTYTHNDLGCKGTKKFWNMQIDEEKSAKYFSFARDLACFLINCQPNEGQI